MAESVVSFVGQTLADLLAQEVKILLEVREKVEQMQNELEKMKRFLKDADRRQDKDETVRNWVSEIREAAYDAEAVIETFAVKIASIRRGGIQNAVKRYACIVNEAKEIQKLNSRMEYIKTKIAELGQDKRIYTIAPENECSTLDKQLRQVFPHVKDSPVGLDRDVKILVAQLVNEDKHCQFFSVCGMGGLGKTTLAKEVFHHSEIRHHFDAVAWASVSQQCNRRNVWEEILINLVLDIKQRTSDKQRKAIRQYTDVELAAELCRVQQVNKCLMILDDLWTEKAWDILKPAFSLRKGGSKILLTTRNKKVARHVHPGVFVHEPECLTQEEGWQLLQREVLRIFPGFQINSYIEESGKEMVGICGGLPLAIIELGRLLLEKEHTLNGWKTVHSNFKEREGHEQQQRRVFEELALSYHELPYQLKPCFLHLGHFPKDFDIPTKKLIRIWVAEGIVSPIVEGVETMEDVGEQYLSELVDRCMVQVRVRGLTGRVKTCRLHDLMRDLCLLKAKQENFLKIVHSQCGNDPMVSSTTKTKSNERVRRLAIYENLSWENETTSYLRSLLFFSTTPTSQKTKPRFSDFQLLKTLDLEHCYIKGVLTTTIGNLVHLRYLSSLNCSRMRVIPSSIGKLRFLQTLIIWTDTSRQIRLPNVIWKMERLRHLCLPYLTEYIMENLSRLQLGNLSHLQTLQGFETESFDVEELTKLTNLKKLGISCLRELEELEKIPSVTLRGLFSLKVFRFWFIVTERDLRKLLAECHHLHKLYLDGQILKIPKYEEIPQTITKLTLCNSKLKEDPMATLEKLPDLKILRLKCEAFIGKKMVCSLRGFPQLKSLVLSDLPNLEEWLVGEEAMPNLCELVIESCLGLRIINMPAEFKNRLQVGGGGLDEVEQVPSIIFKGPHSLLWDFD